MHIVKLLTKINETGLTTNTLDLTESFVKKGHTVTVFIGKSEYYNDGLKYLEERFADSGANIIWYGNVNKSGILQKILQTVFILYKIVCLKPDIIHAQSPYLSFIPWLLRKKFVSTVHVADLPKRFEYKNATRVIAISDETKKYAINHFQYKEDDIDLVFHGVSLRYENKITNSEIKSLKEKLNILDTDIVIGIVASIEKRKGHDILLNAIDKLGSLNSNIKVLIVGSYKSKNEQGWLENEINNTDLVDKVCIVPYQDPKPFYDMMDIFVLPSRLEGFGLVVIEAMLSKCCVVRSDTEGAYDQISHGETGFIFKNENIEELKSILEHLIKDESLRKRVASNGKEFALNNFTSDIMAEKTIEVYQKVINLK
ncbi:glycosyltransferase family 4 protein [Faecalibacter bovis]|uniref:Glycosyltransferase family 4 protein n=1 Tax=Faecalibacter bovis TaxID=2898187 RepID=A0ABX7XFG2_9FLAO|nr:glycosyltransferase family 4 protein [Faecalibacter bovis]QTV06620.1 glycosyltransferase family 4 protein [Faecalibacter bovis]